MDTSRGMDVSVEERFWCKVQPTGFCWEWTASTKPNGYGQFGVTAKPKQRVAYAHRFAYELLIGPIPEGMDLDHVCRNRACVNPDHLEPVTRRANLLRSPITLPGVAANRNGCQQGHPWTSQNVGHQNGSRYCKTCRNARRRHAYAEAKGAA